MQIVVQIFDTISRDFITKGFARTEFSDHADVYVINTCSVTENADRECRNIVGRALKANPDGFIIIVGCYAQLKPEHIMQMPGVDLVLGAHDKFNLLKHLDKLDFKGESKVIQTDITNIDSFHPSYSTGERTRSFLKVQDGCDYNCTYCTIPLARGISRSNNIKNTILTAKKVVSAGAKEIILTGVNIGDFGKGNSNTFIRTGSGIG